MLILAALLGSSGLYAAQPAPLSDDLRDNYTYSCWLNGWR